MSKYKCPACGFQIFNRRVPKCESCGAKLPEELLFSIAEISKLNEQYELSLKASEAKRKKDRNSANSDGGSYGGDASSGGDACGDGGGGGCD